MTKRTFFGEGDDDLLLRLLGTLPIWILRATVGGEGVGWKYALVLAVDGLLVLGTWLAVAPYVRSNSEVGNPASGERFVLLPLVLAALVTLSDVFS